MTNEMGSNANAAGSELARAARLVMLGISLMGVVVLAYAVNRFRSATEMRALVFYGMALAIIAFGVVGSRLRPSLRIGLALLCVTSGAALLVAEWAVGSFKRNSFVRMQESVARVTGVAYDPRSVPEVVRDLWQTDSSAVPSIVPKVLIPYSSPDADPRSAFTADLLPLAGVSVRQTVQLCNENGVYPLYRSDERGFLNPAGSWTSAAGRLVLVGDSFVHGYCVPPDSTLADQLRLRWPSTLNLGTGGSGPLAELGTLVEYALPERPGVVVWSYFENDLADLRNERRHPTMMRYLEPEFTQGLRSRQGAIDSALVPWVRLVYGSDLAPRDFEEHGLRQLLTLNALRTLLLNAKTAETADPKEQLPLLKEILTAARDRTSAAGGSFVMIFLPDWPRYFRSETYDDRGTREAVIATARELGIPVIDMTAAFRAHARPAELFSRREIATGHYSVVGYQLVARTLERGLDSLGLTARLDRPRGR
jgi:hypothetical protein